MSPTYSLPANETKENIYKCILITLINRPEASEINVFSTLVYIRPII